MIANSRGSQRLAGAASLRYRMPAVNGTFRLNLDIAQWQSNSLISCRSRVQIPLSPTLLETTSPNE